jgi:hypothetical protein
MRQTELSSAEDANQTAWAIGLLVVLGLLVIVVVSLDLEHRTGIGNLIDSGILLGTMLGFVSLAAAWLPLGSGRLARRLTLSLGLLPVLIVVIAFSSVQALPRMYDQWITFLMTGITAAVLVLEWLVAQLPLWWLAIAYGLRIARTGGGAESDLGRLQFGTRQLLMVTTGVAVLLGLGRMAVIGIVDSDLMLTFGPLRAASTLSFLALSSLVVVLPLFLASLLPRGAILATLVALCFCVVATGVAIPLLNKLEYRAGVRAAEIWLLATMTATQAIWILAFTGVLRLGGYRLTTALASVDLP